MEMVPFCKPPSPDPVPSAEISELTELLDWPLGPKMTMEGPLMQGWGREEGLSAVVTQTQIQVSGFKTRREHDIGTFHREEKNKRRGPPCLRIRLSYAWKIHTRSFFT